MGDGPCLLFRCPSIFYALIVKLLFFLVLSGPVLSRVALRALLATRLYDYAMLRARPPRRPV